jgi:chitinase
MPRIAKLLAVAFVILIWGASSAQAAPPTRIQQIACEATGASTTCTLGSSVTTGDVLVWYGTASIFSAVPTVTAADNCGGTYTTVDSATAAGTKNTVAQGYATGSHGSCIVTISGSGTAGFMTGIVFEISSATLDVHSILSGQSVGAGGMVTTTSVTTTAADLALSYAVDAAANGTAASVAASFTVRASNNVVGEAGADFTQSVSGAVTATWTMPKVTTDAVVCMMTFSTASGGGGGGGSPQWISGYYSNTVAAEPISVIPWQFYTHMFLFKMVPNVNGSNNADGTVFVNYVFTNQNITDFVAGAHAAGVKAIVTIADNDFHTSALLQATAPGLLSTFVTNIASTVSTWGFDGVDIDWEQNQNAAQDEAWISALHTAMPTTLLTFTGPNAGTVFQAVSAAESSILNQVNVQCYDMDLGEGKTEYNDQLFQAGNGALRACDWAVKAFTTAGVPAAKIGVGIPFYGRRWPGSTLAFQTTGVTPSTVIYSALVTDGVRFVPANEFFDSTFKSDYLSIASPAEFDSYTGPTTIAAAVTWGKAQGYGGFMTFAINYEYVSSFSGNARFPLSSVLNGDVGNNSIIPSRRGVIIIQ